MRAEEVMTRYDATNQELATARHNLTRRLLALEKATADQRDRIQQGHSPDLRAVNRAWLAIDEALLIHRACERALRDAV